MIYMFIAEGFEEIEALCPLDLIRRAGLDIKTVGIGGEYVTGAHGITVKTDMTDAEYPCDTADMIFLPGGMPGASHLDASSAVDAFIDEAEKADAYIAAICAAPMILGKRGLLRGRKATCFPGFEEYLEGAEYMDVHTVTDGRFITGRAMGAATEFALALVKALKGDGAADVLRAAVFA